MDGDPQGTFPCTLCVKVFQSKSGIKYHLKAQSGISFTYADSAFIPAYPHSILNYTQNYILEKKPRFVSCVQSLSH